MAFWETVMIDVRGGWVSCSQQGFEGIWFALSDCRACRGCSSSLSYVVFAIFTGLVAEDWCQWSLAVNISLDCLPDNLMKGRD